MTLRRNRQRTLTTMNDVVEALPARFLRPELAVEDGQLVGLQAYMRDLAAWLRQANVRQFPVTEVMETIGCPASEWYARALR